MHIVVGLLYNLKLIDTEAITQGDRLHRVT